MTPSPHPHNHISILGATGSIGQQTLDLIHQHAHYQLHSAVSNYRWEDMVDICEQFSPRYAAMQYPASHKRLQQALQDRNSDTQCLPYEDVLAAATSDPDVDTVVAGVTGAAGLPGVIRAAQAGKRIALANKEAMVLAGDTINHLCQQHGATILPVDSEHNALFQCLPDPRLAHANHNGLHKIWLTASGGPFLTRSLRKFDDITPEMAVKHPKWSMGQKISVDSATLMNKGLEIIEAMHLFGLPADKIDAVIHPQSMVHSFVEYIDGSFLAQLGVADMRIPIAYALSWPERVTTGTKTITPMEFGTLAFEPIDTERYPCFKHAKAAMHAAGWAPLVLNAANEVAVEAFLQRRIRFTAIAPVVEKSLNALASFGFDTATIQPLEAIIAMDKTVRAYASTACEMFE